VSRGPWTRYHWLAVGCCLVVFVAAGLIAGLVLEGVPHLEDEVAYLFQAQVFAAGKTHVDAPFRSNCFFAPFVVDYEGRRFGKYSPGWPALLSVGVLLGQTWWVNAAGAALTVALVFRLGHEGHGLLVGGLSSGLASTSPFLLILAGSMMSHTWCLVFTTSFLLLFRRAYRRVGRHNGLAWAAGAMLGAAFVIRPFTAAAVATPAVLYSMWRIVRHRSWKLAWFLCIGFAPLALLVPLLNAIWTGDPFLSPYVLFWPYDRIGFGPGTGPLSEGNSVWVGLSGAAAAIGHLANHLHGWPTLSLLFVVLGFLPKPRRRWDIFLACTVFSLILAYVAYWTSGDVFGPRYTYEVASALFVLSAAGIVRVGRWLQHSGRQWILYAVVGLLLATNVVFYMPWQMREYKGLYGITAEPREILRQADLDNALVIVDDKGGWYDYAVAFSLNTPTLDGRVVYANDCTPYNDELLTHYAGRQVYYFDGERVWTYDSWQAGGDT
jgi:4-amino-4-deoxy-L-arabinose transferase-like glycosyltransferase